MTGSLRTKCSSVALRSGCDLVQPLKSATPASQRSRATRKANTCRCAYQRDVEEARPKAPSAPPPPNFTRPPPPPPPPPPTPALSEDPTRRTLLALVAIGSVAYGFNVTQRKEPETQSVSAMSKPPASPSRTAELYANSQLRPTRVWPQGTPENPYTKVIYWRNAPYVVLKRGGWMRVYGMQSGRAGKVEVILEARGGNQYLLEVPLKQVKPWDLQLMNTLFNSMIDWEATLQLYKGKIKNRDKALQ